MNRHPALMDLFRDHQTALLHAQRLAKAAETGPSDALRTSRGYLAWHTQGMLSHLDEEVALVLPLLPPAMQGRFQMVEEQLRNTADELRITLMDPTFFRPAVRAMAAVLREHVAYCEADLFPELQALLEPPRLEELGRKLLAYRKANRPLAIGAAAREPTGLE